VFSPSIIPATFQSMVIICFSFGTTYDCTVGQWQAIILLTSYAATFFYAVRRWPKRRYAAHNCILVRLSTVNTAFLSWRLLSSERLRHAACLKFTDAAMNLLSQSSVYSFTAPSVTTSGSAAFKIRALVVLILLKRKVKSCLCKFLRILFFTISYFHIWTCVYAVRDK